MFVRLSADQMDFTRITESKPHGFRLDRRGESELRSFRLIAALECIAKTALFNPSHSQCNQTTGVKTNRQILFK
jgi:hypothetical protein